MAVTEPGTLSANTDVQREASLVLRRLEVVLHVSDDPVYGIAIEQQEAVVVGNAVQAVQDLLLLQFSIPIPVS